MSRLIYGSSNVYRNFSRSALGSDLRLQLIQCTKKIVFDSHLGSLGKLDSGSLLVTSVLENFISDVCRDLPADEASHFANQQIAAHVEALASLACDSSGSSVFISPLLLRNAPGPLYRVVVVLRKKIKQTIN
jgi:hypothetical protein